MPDVDKLELLAQVLRLRERLEGKRVRWELARVTELVSKAKSG